MRFENYSKNKSSKKYTLQPEQGGTGVRTKEEAHAILDSVDKSFIGMPGGVLGLNEKGFIDSKHLPTNIGGVSSVTIYGPREVKVGGSIVLQITNFDSFTTYTLKTHKVDAIMEDDTIIVTGRLFGNDAYISINGSIYSINVTLENPPINGDAIYFKTLDSQFNKLAVNEQKNLLVVSNPTKEYVGSPNAGEVQIYSFNSNNGFKYEGSVSPSVLKTRINYSGNGTKRFTFNNQTVVKTDQGYIDIQGAGNIIIEAQGTVVQVPGRPSQGSAAFPNGIPAYTYRDGTEIVLINNATPPVDTFGLTPTDNFKYLSLETAEQGGEFGPEFWSISNAYREQGYSVKNVFLTPDSFNTKKGSLLILLENASGQQIQATTNYQLNNLRITLTGNPNYPAGLPPYQPATAAYEYRDTVTIVGENFSVTGEDIYYVAKPFDNVMIGGSISVDGLTIVSGSGRSNFNNFNNGGEIFISQLINSIWVHTRLTSEKKSLYSRFGENVLCFGNGTEILVSSPGEEKLYYFKTNTNKVFELIRSFNAANLNNNSGFGHSFNLDPTKTVLAVTAPNRSEKGYIYLFNKSGTNINELEAFEAPLPDGFKLGNQIRVVSSTRIFVNINSSIRSQDRVVSLEKIGNVWTLTKEFTNPNGNNDDGFSKDFEVNENGTLLYVSSPGTNNSLGTVYIWIKDNNVWNLAGSVLNPYGFLGDRFSQEMNIYKDGRSAFALSKTASNNSQILYLE